jgi:hypothetical protein
VQLRLSCAVRGLGPRFKISLDLMQSVQAGAQPLFNVSVALVYAAAFYHMERPLLVLPIMLPGVHYFPQFDITCVDPLGAADTVRAVVCVGPGGGQPSISAQVAMQSSVARARGRRGVRAHLRAGLGGEDAAGGARRERASHTAAPLPCIRKA